MLILAFAAFLAVLCLRESHGIALYNHTLPMPSILDSITKSHSLHCKGRKCTHLSQQSSSLVFYSAFVRRCIVREPRIRVHAIKSTFKPEKVLLVDATGLAYRCFFALPELKTHKGTDIACLMGFMNSLVRLYKMFSPKYVGLAFDSPGANRSKREIWPEYKTNRQIIKTSFRKQLAWIRELCAIIGLPVFIERTTEADDIITSIISFLRGNDKETGENMGKEVKQFNILKRGGGGIFDKITRHAHVPPTLQLVPCNDPDWQLECQGGFDVTVVTADKDLLQILSDNHTNNVSVKIVQPHKKYRVVTGETVQAEYGLLHFINTANPGVKPERFSEYLALVGDAADNIPGVLGIGPKTAPKLIAKYGSFEVCLGVYGNFRKL
ncbi:bifunctional 5'-3' exonuclease [Babesia duncani]|uniref:Bifunctional 5'-3' exonuclease n=1 Tax=Babesia duncani TaxID=323732 RepID=A0AAD9UN94_9APIC|nr:bifunctional 5'-3' exonuclease [Babesia duncani]